MVFLSIPNLIALNRMELHFPLVPTRLRVQCCPSSVAPTCFWLVVVVLNHHLAAIYGSGVDLLLFFSVAQFDNPNNWITSHPNLRVQCVIAPTYSLLLPLTFGWLLCLSIEWQPSKAKGSPISLF